MTKKGLLPSIPIPLYFTERLFGYCRPLFAAPLANSNLSSAKLSGADLLHADFRDTKLIGAKFMFADLKSADLRGAKLGAADFLSADLRGADLSGADLGAADLSNAFFNGADLRDADLNSAILFATDFRTSKNLTMEQLIGKNAPHLCNVALPANVTDIDPHRDCDKIPQLFSDRYSWISLEEAQEMVEEVKAKTWE